MLILLAEEIEMYSLQLPLGLRPTTVDLMACQSAFLIGYWRF